MEWSKYVTRVTWKCPPADHPRAREGLLIQQFDSCQGDGLLPLQGWQRPCLPTSTHCFCSGQVSDQWIIVDADVRDAWLGLLHSAPKRKLSTSDSKSSSTSHVESKYRGEKLTIEQQQDVSTWLASHDPGFITSFSKPRLLPSLAATSPQK